METMIKDPRQEVFTNSTKEAERLYKNTPNFFCSNQSSNAATQSPQLLNRKKASNSFKSLNSEPIELETTNDLYHFNGKNRDRFNISSPMIKKEVSMINDSYRESDFINDNDDTTGKSEKKILSFQNDKNKSQQNVNTVQKLKNNANSTHKLTKSKSDVASNNLLNNFGSSSLIATKIQCDKNTKKKSKDKKNKKHKEKKHSSAVNIHNSENHLMNDMFRNNENNSLKLNMKMNRKEPINQYKPIIKKTFSVNNVNNKTDKPISPEKENLNTIRWRFELDDPVEEEKRIEIYKQDRRKRYIEQRNKQILLTNGTASFLPYLYYENVEKPSSPKPPTEASDIGDNNTDNMLETTVTVDPELNNLNRVSSAASSRIIINDDSNIEEKNTLNKETHSNVTTDSAISSLSSSSR